MATTNNITCFKGEAVVFTFTMSPTTDITGWHISFTLKANAPDSVTLLTVAGVITAPAASGIFTISMTHAQTNIAVGAYAYDVQRTDSGSEAVLSIGHLNIVQEVLY